MWSRKKWLIIAAVAIAVVVLAGGIGGVALAQTGDQTSGKTLLARVATILGIDQTKVENAFAQAQKDMRNEALTNRLNDLVKQGKMTQQQADDYQKWLNSKPNVPAPAFGPGGHMGFRGFPGMWGPKPPVPPTTTPPATQ